MTAHASGVARRDYVGRFAPSPTGPLHAGSLATALGSFLDARAHGGRWLVRIEDLDPPREQPGASAAILELLRRLGLNWDGEPLFQSTRGADYTRALDRLTAAGRVYPCGCTRREIADSQSGGFGLALRHGELPYPGTCRDGLPAGRTARAWRLRVPVGTVRFTDRLAGEQEQDVAGQVGDFVLKRADGLWAYQMAVVIDDCEQGVTDVVRGADLLGSTARQRVLGEALGFAIPRCMHLPVVAGADGEKLSKQNGAVGIDPSRPQQVLADALRHLGLEPPPVHHPLEHWLSEATSRWRQWLPREAGTWS